MNKSKYVLALVTVPAMLLSGCARKVSFDKFQDAVKEIQIPETLKVDEVKFVVKGKIEDTKLNYTVSGTADEVAKQLVKDAITTDEGTLAAVMLIGVLMELNVSEFAIEEMKDASYYAGSTFKVSFSEDGEKETVTFNKYGVATSLVAKSDDGSAKATAKYKFSK